MADAPRTPDARHPLDRPAARVVALALSAALVALLVYIHRDDLFGPAAGAAPDNPQRAACLDQRLGDVRRMVDEGLIDDGQATLFRNRAEALCHGQYPD